MSNRPSLSQRETCGCFRVLGLMRKLSNKTRAAITLATALALGAVTYGGMLHSNGVWGVSNSVVHLLAVVGVFVVYRWWALLPALVPSLVGVYVRDFTDYVEPTQRLTLDLSGPFWFVTLIALAILIQAAILAVGLLARALWERRDTKRRSRRLPKAV